MRNRIIWIVIVAFVWYLIIGAGIFGEFIAYVVTNAVSMSDSVFFVFYYYTTVIGDILALIILLTALRKNRFIFWSFLPGKPTDEVKRAARLTVSAHDNTVSKLFYGLLLGFLTNFVCILCAMIHGDIKLVLDFSASQIPVMLFALISVFIQSTGEELWCRGFLYERINVHYPLWVAILINSTLFGLLHVFNPGATVLAIADIMICGLSYSLLRWYTGSIWAAMGIHTGWNFTQNFLFGLPNSGLVSEVSVFHLDAANGTTNLIYDYLFGVEGALPAVLVDLLLGVIILVLAYKQGRFKELTMTREKLLAAEFGHPEGLF